MGTKAGTIAFKKERAKEVSFKKKFPDIDIPGKLLSCVQFLLIAMS